MILHEIHYKHSITKLYNPSCDSRVSECIPVNFESIYNIISMDMKTVALNMCTERDMRDEICRILIW